MFIMGPMHTRDHDPGCSVAGLRNQPWGPGRGRVLLYAHAGRRSHLGARTRRGTSEASQVESKF